MKKIPIREVVTQIGMTHAAVNQQGFSLSDELPLDEAIAFVERRTIPAGRWTQERANAAKSYLLVLKGLKDAENTPADNAQALPTPANNHARDAGKFEYFELKALLYGHSALVGFDLWDAYSVPGLILATMYAIFAHNTIRSACDASKEVTSANNATVYTIATLCAWWLHYNSFKSNVTFDSSMSMVESGYTAGGLAVLAVVFAIRSMWALRGAKIAEYLAS